MKVNIRKSIRRNYNERLISRGFNVFVTSNATQFVDDWFEKNKLWELDIKSKAWMKMSRACSKLNIVAMRSVFGDDNNIVFSHYTGCSSCPCSPGYRVRKCVSDVNRDYFNHDVWMDIEVDIAPLRTLSATCDEMLELDRAQLTTR